VDIHRARLSARTGYYDDNASQAECAKTLEGSKSRLRGGYLASQKETKPDNDKQIRRMKVEEKESFSSDSNHLGSKIKAVCEYTLARRRIVKYSGDYDEEKGVGGNEILCPLFLEKEARFAARSPK